MAYISFAASQFIPFRNHITINGSSPIHIQNGFYKISDGRYSVVVHGANGQAWECEGSIRSYGLKTACMNIRLAQDDEGNIVNAQYAIFDMTSQQEFAAMTTAKKLDVSIPSYGASSYEDHDDLPGETSGSKTTSEPSAPTAPSTPPVPPAPSKKGGTGWIVFGVICLAAAFLTAEGIASVISCGVIGAASLLFGIHKKKG